MRPGLTVLSARSYGVSSTLIFGVDLTQSWPDCVFLYARCVFAIDARNSVY